MSDRIGEAVRFLTRVIAVDDILEDGSTVVIESSEEERRKISDELDLSGLQILTATFDLRRKARGRVQARGVLRAVYTQLCVVSLDTIENKICENVQAEFWPEAQIIEVAQSEVDDDSALDLEPLAGDGPDPILNGEIDLGQLIYETLATVVDPFPRKEDAEFEWDSGFIQDDDTSGNNPFAVLEKLKK